MPLAKLPPKPKRPATSAQPALSDDINVTMRRASHRRFCQALIATKGGLTGNINPVLSELADDYADKAGIPR